MTTESKHAIRIVIVDNLTMIRAGFRLIIANQTDLELVAEAGNLLEALQSIEATKPDIVLLVLSQEGDLDIKSIPQIVNAAQKGRVILITRSTSHDLYIQALQYGVVGVVLKTQSPEVLIKAIRKVHEGEAWIERSLVASLLTQFSINQPVTPTARENECVAHLNQREQDIVQLIGLGLNTRQIAKKLFLSESTVRHNLTTVYEKVGVSGRLELLVFAYRVGLTDRTTLSI